MTEVMRKHVRTYYHSLTPDGKVWCESSDPLEVRRMTHPTLPLTYEKFLTYEVSDGWMEWEMWTR